ncbi:MAG: nickel pincer cofactor biosynthesis protein LarC [Thermodesulfovibrionales bacterium]|nr:nickel pincer cofactor biosynthesis protein LarC [Thermodesulfovibrionales bacterium]
MRILYFDCFSGISGDMCVGALLDLGIKINKLKDELKKLPIKGYSLTLEKVQRCGINATKFIVTENRAIKRKPIKLSVIEEIIDSSKLSRILKEKGLKLFKRLFEVEAKVHGKALDDVHLHELGAIDSLVDIFGTLIALDMLEIDKVFTSKINLGGGIINISHGILPVPSPATVELLKGYPVYSSGVDYELTTPTGALIISALESVYSPIPSMHIEKIGYGAGSKDFQEFPNILRIFIGKELNSNLREIQKDTVTIIETNIDDMNPQLYEPTINALLKAGALDVTLENITMKRGRPAIKVTVISNERDVESLINILFLHTTSIGVRFYNARRVILKREIKTVKTTMGDIRVKISYKGNEIINIQPEYVDLLEIAEKTNIPIKEITYLISSQIKKEMFKKE